MLEGVSRKLYNAHGMKSLTKPVTDPPAHMSVGGDDEMSNVPLVIYRGQSLPQPAPVVDYIQNIPYEKTALKGAGDTLSLEDFVTDDFNLGAEYDSLY